MSERRKANVQGAAYFVTFTVLGWVDVFTRKVLAEELIKNIQYSQHNKGLRVFCLCDHVKSRSHDRTKGRRNPCRMDS